MITYKFKFKDEAGFYTSVKTVANDAEREAYIKKEWQEYHGLCIGYSLFIHPTLANLNKNQNVK